MADELLRPSVIYTPAVLAVRAALGDALHACAHITGGGIVGNLPRALPADLGAVLDRSAWEEPRVFAEIQRLGSVAEDEMDRVFNRGVGMALVLDAASAGEALQALEEAGQPASVIGEVVPGAGVRVRVSEAGFVRRLRDHLLQHSVKTGDFTLKSGRKSSWFIDSKQTVCRPEAMLLVADAVLSVVPTTPRRSAGSPWAPTPSPS